MRHKNQILNSNINSIISDMAVTAAAAAN